ncbi:MAG: hypothetical protein IAE99_10105 [Rhodothermales bacterium]|nr:hypothetical protein [Rhodothermales bacterium]
MIRFALLLLLAAPAAAQWPMALDDGHPPREGFWAETGIGGGGSWVGCEGCDATPGRPSGVGYLRIGGKVDEKVAVGLELFRSLEPTRLPAELDSAVAVSNASLGPVVLWYPWRRAVFARVGVGLALKRAFLDRTGQPRTQIEQGIGAALSFGAGVDVPLRPRYALTLAVGAHYGAVGDIQTPGVLLDDVIATLYSATVGLTLR